MNLLRWLAYRDWDWAIARAKHPNAVITMYEGRHCVLQGLTQHGWEDIPVVMQEEVDHGNVRSTSR